MARKSARMLRVGMTIIIDGRRQTITTIMRDIGDDDNQRVIITCGNNVYRRTPGTKIDVI